MPPSKGHQSKPVISVTNGRQVGEVKDLYLDAGLTKVVAVLVGKEGLLGRKTLVVDRLNVQVMGIDAWLVAKPDVVVELSSLPGNNLFIQVGALRGREIQTDGGTKIAAVDDVILDADANVIGFTLGRLYVQGPLAERKTIARAAIANFGSKDAPMITALAKAEAMDAPTA